MFRWNISEADTVARGKSSRGIRGLGGCPTLNYSVA